MQTPAVTWKNAPTAHPERTPVLAFAPPVRLTVAEQRAAAGRPS